MQNAKFWSYKTFKSKDADRQRLCARCLASVTERVPSTRARVAKSDPTLTRVGKLLEHPVEGKTFRISSIFCMS